MVVLSWITNSFGEQTLVLEITRLGLPPRTDNSMDIADAPLLIVLVYSRDPLQLPKHKYIESQWLLPHHRADETWRLSET